MFHYQISRLVTPFSRPSLLKRTLFFHAPNCCLSYQSHTPYFLPSARLVGERLNITTDAWQQATCSGFFQVLVPENQHHHLTELRSFSREFYKNRTDEETPLNQYRGFNLTFNHQHPFAASAVEEGYMVDNHKGLGETQENQVERFSLKKSAPTVNHWQDFYPPKIQAGGEFLNEIALLVLVTAMKKLQLQSTLWPAATGNAIVNKGAHYLLFNHYRPDVATRGLKAHQDWSNVSVLVTDEQEKDRHALEAHIDGKWRTIAPSSDRHVIINFGLLLELLTQCLAQKDRIKGAVHRVVQQSYSRSSCVLFADHALHTPIYQLTPDKQQLTPIHDNFSAFVVEASKKTYEGEDDTWEATSTYAAH